MTVVNLDVETTLEKFVQDWDLEIKKVNEAIENSETYEDEYILIRKGRDNDLIVNLKTEFLGTVSDMIYEIYGDEYLFIVKNVYYGDKDYTIFTAEIPLGTVMSVLSFQGGENNEKTILDEYQISEFSNLLHNGDIKVEVEYQESWIVKKNNLFENRWKETLNSLGLYDWIKYNF